MVEHMVRDRAVSKKNNKVNKINKEGGPANGQDRDKTVDGTHDHENNESCGKA